MANLAIKGHTTRGEEVIEILEMLGGKNKVGLLGKNETLVYFIKNGVIYNNGMNLQTLPFKTFTLEEFLKKFPYKVGDKVCFPDDLSTPFTINKMWWDENANELLCSFIEDDIEVPVVGIRTYKEKSIDKTNKVIFESNAQCCDIMNHLIKQESMEENLEQIIVNIPYGYEFFGIDDNNKVVFTKKQSQYPKTYEECCEVLGYEPDRQTVTGYDAELIVNLQKLKLCRDAYWKIAGEQMGLGKPWEPDWLNGKQDKYVLFTHNNAICSNRYVLGHNILAFPTEEMRDAFYENFKELIEACKELL